jgi:hypothetical protein
MIDWDDVELGSLVLPVTGVVTAIIFVIVMAVLILNASENEHDCMKRECPSGQQPRLMDNDCLCVSKAK